jgi:hypothetical protein
MALESVPVSIGALTGLTRQDLTRAWRYRQFWKQLVR